MRNLLCLFLAFILVGCATTSSQTLMLKDVSLNYIVHGEGPPLYFLHGGMESRDSFKNQIPEFAKSFTVVAMDSREQGRSGTSDTQISYEGMAKDVHALAKHLGHDRISIVGLSDGGVTALTLAIRNPEIIDKLVLISANFHFTSYPLETRQFITNYKWDGNTDPKAFPGIFIEHYLTGQKDLTSFGDTLKEMAIMWTTSPTFTAADLHTIKAKTLVISGHKQDTNRKHVLDLYKAIPMAQIFFVRGSAHESLVEESKLINPVVIKFLKAD